MVCRSFQRLVLRIIVANNDLRLEFVQSYELSDAVKQSLNHRGTVLCGNNNAELYRHDVNPIEPGVITNFFQLKTQPDSCAFRVVPAMR